MADKTAEQKNLEAQVKLLKEIVKTWHTLKYQVTSNAKNMLDKMQTVKSNQPGERKTDDPIVVDKETWDLIWKMFTNLHREYWGELGQESQWIKDEIIAMNIKEEILNSLQ